MTTNVRSQQPDPASLDNLAVVIPAYNAGRHLAGVVEQVATHVPRGRIIAVDDGSTDDTATVASGLGVDFLQHSENQGKGAALLTGMRRALDQGLSWAVTLDADGQHDPNAIPAFAARQRETGADIIVGNRLEDPKDMPTDRLLTNRVTSWVVSKLARQHVPDSQNGYRLISTALLNSINLESSRYEFESEFLIKAGRAGARIASVPIESIYGDEVSSINKVKDTGRFFRMAMRALFW